MAEPVEDPVLESAATLEVQAEAEKMGWIPPTRFKGDVERFVDADEYIKRGETVLPIVKEQNKRLHAELEAVRAESSKTAAALAAAQIAIEQIEERHSVSTHKAVADARRELKAQLAEASEASDHTAVAELTDQLTQLKDAEEKPAAKKIEATEPTIHPDMAAWNRENPWFGTNKRKTALALGIAQELREGGETKTGRAFFDLVTEEVDKELHVEPTRESKVESGRNTGERTGGRKSFDSLPADARAACEADARDFVGPDKKYKTAAEWRKRYAEIYFEQEA